MVKKLFKSKIFLCILTALITGTVSVYAVTYFPSNQVTYDNKTSGLKSSDVQGAIDELYNTCSSAVSSGDYLYFSVGGYSYGATHGRPEIYRMSINGGETMRIYSHSSISNIESMYVSQDYIYFSVGNYLDDSTKGYPEIYRIGINGGEATRIYSHSSSSNIEGMYVSQDYIYFSVGNYLNDSTKGYPEIYRMSINGGEATRIYSHRSISNIESMFIR